MSSAAFELDVRIVSDAIVAITRGNCGEVGKDTLEGFEEFCFPGVN